MEFVRRRPRAVKRMLGAAGAAAALAVATTVIVAPQASAEDKPSVAELLKQCNTTSSLCKFHPQRSTEYIGPNHLVGAITYNCAGGGEKSVGGEDQTTSSDSVGVAITTTAGFEGVFEVSFEASYNHTWERSHTDKEEFKKNLDSFEKGWVERGTPKDKVLGWYEIQFKKRYYGHFDWRITNYEESGFDTARPSAGYVNLLKAPMTAKEKHDHCHVG
ncbi:hypothetical protein [Streptomyces sp. 4F14]|uniref:hypothetical protein n=1 Tax=Streptomyces sp. 4F14 TaxID=3394380 RepID=UPI003A8B541B